MKLCFPNPSRSFDESKNRVRFFGYDSAIEILFFIEAEALKKLCPTINENESEYLQVFDGARNKIHEVANNIYVHDSKGYFSYILTVRDFK